MQKRVIFSSNAAWSIYNFRRSLVERLLDEGWSVGFLTPWDEYAQRLVDRGCIFHELRLDNKSTNPITELRTVLRYIRLYKKFKGSVVLHFAPKPNIYGSLAARMNGIPCINNIAGLGSGFIGAGSLQRVLVQLYKWSQGAAKCVFFQNQDDQRLFEQKKIVKPNQSRLLPGSGVDLKYFPFTELVPPTPFVFLLVGRLLKDKGVMEFAEAAKRVKEKYPQAVFQLLGYVDHNNPSAINEEDLQRWVKEGLVEWLGKQEDVRPFLAKAHCVVLPSYREGTPRTLLEAASMGRPLIAADSVGTREPVDPRVNGYLCRTKDFEDLSLKMIQMLELPFADLQKMGLKSRQKMESQYDVEIVTTRYLQEIERYG